MALDNGVEIVLNERKVYEVDWLEDCYKRVRFPNPKCEEFLVEVNKILSHKLRGELDNQIKQQVLFKLLGEDYVRIHFPHHNYNPKILEKASQGVKDNYIKEMKLYIEEQLAITMVELGYPEDLSQVQETTNLSEFVKAVSKTFKDELDRQVKDEVENNRILEIEVAADEATRSRKNSVTGQSSEFEQSRVPAVAFVGTAKVNKQVKDAAILMFRDKVMPFPEPIRKFLWLEWIKSSGEMQGRSKKSKDDDFSTQLKKALKGGKLQSDRAVQSSEYKSIYSVIIDCYATSKVLKSIADDSNMLNSAHVINVISNVSKEYTNTQIFFLVPLQAAFGQEEGETQETYIVRMSTILNLVTTNYALSPGKVFAAVKETLSCLKNFDPDYVDFLQKTFANRVVAVNVHDFPQECLLKDAKKSAKLWKDLYERSKNKKKVINWKDSELEVFNNPDIYLRKWIAEAFAGVLSDPELGFAWDILFFNEWSQDCFTKLALVLVLLIKPWAMRAENNRQIAKVFLEEPSNIYIGDFRNAVEAIFTDGVPIHEIPLMNSNIEVVTEPSPRPVEDPAVDVEVSLDPPVDEPVGDGTEPPAGDGSTPVPEEVVEEGTTDDTAAVPVQPAAAMTPEQQA